MKFTKKNIPDIISVSRIIISLIILFIPYKVVLFIILYSVCGISDVADGFLARRLKCAGKNGATLDSIADVTLLVATVSKLITRIDINPWIIILVVFILFAKFYVLYKKNSKLGKGMFYHTYANKLTGLLLFTVPYLYKLHSLNIYCLVICMVAVLAVIDEYLIVKNSEEFNDDIKSILDVKNKKTISEKS